MRGATIRRTFAICALAVGLALIAAPASAQSGQVKGKVTDAKGQPIDGAKVTIANIETAGRKLETKTNKKGEYIQIGLQPGRYTVTVELQGFQRLQQSDVIVLPVSNVTLEEMSALFLEKMLKIGRAHV